MCIAPRNKVRGSIYVNGCIIFPTVLPIIQTTLKDYQQIIVMVYPFLNYAGNFYRGFYLSHIDMIFHEKVGDCQIQCHFTHSFSCYCTIICHDDVIKWKHFPRYWLFVRGIHRSPVNSPHKGQWRGALKFSLNCVWKNDWVNNREAGDFWRYPAHYDITVMRCTRFVGAYKGSSLNHTCLD